MFAKYPEVQRVTADGLAWRVVVVCDELTAAIGVHVLEAKSQRHDGVLHEFYQSRQRLVLRLDEVDNFELGIMVGALDHETVVPARCGCHVSQEVGFDGP